MSKATRRAQALTEAVETHGDSLISMITRRVRDEVEAKDIAQETFAEFIQAYDVDEVFESLGAWLTKVAQNKVLDRFRRKKTEAKYQESVISEDPDDSLSLGRPDDELTRTWLRAEIADAVESLPAEQREVFLLHEIEGKSFEEISQITGRNVNTLLSQKRYAILFLRTYLKEIYDELE